MLFKHFDLIALTSVTWKKTELQLKARQTSEFHTVCPNLNSTLSWVLATFGDCFGNFEEIFTSAPVLRLTTLTRLDCVWKLLLYFVFLRSFIAEFRGIGSKMQAFYAHLNKLMLFYNKTEYKYIESNFSSFFPHINFKKENQFILQIFPWFENCAADFLKFTLIWNPSDGMQSQLYVFSWSKCTGDELFLGSWFHY